MPRFGYFLSCEEFGPAELVRQAKLAEQAGFDRLWISDHYHPWNSAQGQSPFVWSVIGALSEATSLPIATAVTCPTIRLHPAVIAQAAATAAVQCKGRFTLGVGSGEALNEHIFGDAWPSAPTRLAMLREAVEVIRALHTGEQVSFDGEYYTVENARIYTLPEGDSTVPIYMSGFGQKSAELAGEIGDGFMSVQPDGDLVKAFQSAGGAGKPTQAGLKVCHADTAEQAVRTVHRLWPNDQLPGELAQVLPTPRHFEQASTLVSPDMVAAAVPCGNEVGRFVNAITGFVDAGFDEIYLQQIGPDQEKFFEFWTGTLAPEVGATTSGG
jgi:G6PDH family F420-dependent oxidoreductase